MIKKLLVNITSILIIFIIFDWYTYAVINKSYRVDYFNYNVLKPNDRNESDLPFDKRKRPIITIGCSFVYGSGISQNETLAYKLQKATMCKTYNLGYPATGPQHVLYQLQNSEFFNNNDINPEYFIYVFISDHMRRLYANYFLDNDRAKYIRYRKYNKNKLIINYWNKKEPLDYLKITSLGKKFNALMYKIKTDDELFDFLKLHLIESKSIIDKKYKDAKFSVVVYNPKNDTHNFREFRTERWSELENEGIKVIRFDGKDYEFLSEKAFLSDEDYVHPNGKAWDILVPEIIKQLGI